MKRKWVGTAATLGSIVVLGIILQLLVGKLQATPPSEPIANYYSAQHPEWPPLPAPTASNLASHWWMSDISGDSRYPYAGGLIQDNFGRGGGVAEFNSGLTTLATLHVYNPMAKSNQWSGAFNDGTRHTTGNTLSFPPTYSLLGRGASTFSEYLHGELAEVLIFNRELTQPERDTIYTNYLSKRFLLW